MIFKYVVKVGDAIWEINRFIVKTKVRVVPDGGIPAWRWGDLVILLVFHQAARVVAIVML